jgi:hypothetical protein
MDFLQLETALAAPWPALVNPCQFVGAKVFNGWITLQFFTFADS